MSRFKLPDGYAEREDIVYFDDAPYGDSAIIHQPEVYDAAGYLLAATGRSTLIDIGCGNGRKLLSVTAPRRIGMDFGPNIRFCREHHPDAAEWREIDLSVDGVVSEALMADGDTVIVCADVVEHLMDPGPLLVLLAACHRRGAIVITSTPDRIRVRGPEHRGRRPIRRISANGHSMNMQRCCRRTGCRPSSPDIPSTTISTASRAPS